jgi:hypothetical protein
MCMTFKQWPKLMIFGAASFVVSLSLAPVAWAITPDVVQYSGDGTVWNADVAGQYNFLGASVNPVAQGTLTNLTNQEQGPSAVLDAGGTSWILNDTTAGDPNAFVSLRLTLSQDTYVRKFKTWVDTNHKPSSYQIYTSTTGFGSLTQAVGPTAIGAGALNTLTLNSAVQARFIEYRFSGVAGTGNTIGLEEFQVYADQALQPRPTSSDGFNLTTLGTTTISSSNPAKWLDPVSQVINQDFEGQFRGANSGDADFTVDLHGEFVLTELAMGFRHNNAWNQGAKVEVSSDGINWTIVRNQVGGNFGTQLISVPRITAEFVRVTDYGGSNNALNELEIFGTIPEPTTFSIFALSACSLLIRRKRRLA